MDGRRMVVFARDAGQPYAGAFRRAGYDVVVVAADGDDVERHVDRGVAVVLLRAGRVSTATIGRLAGRCALAAYGGDRASRIEALDAGVDVVLDDPTVAVAQVDALLRRRGTLRTVRRLGDVVVDLERSELHAGRSTLSLTRTECAVLAALVAASGRPISKTDLLASVWDDDVYDPNIVEVHVSHLRRKLRRSGDPRIETVRGCGYSLRIAPEQSPSVAPERRRADDHAVDVLATPA